VAVLFGAQAARVDVQAAAQPAQGELGQGQGGGVGEAQGGLEVGAGLARSPSFDMDDPAALVVLRAVELGRGVGSEPCCSSDSSTQVV
jgi:hypothetical protein